MSRRPPSHLLLLLLSLALTGCPGIERDPLAFQRYEGFDNSLEDAERFEQIRSAFEDSVDRPDDEILARWEPELLELATRHPTNLRVLSLLQDVRVASPFRQPPQPVASGAPAVRSFLEARQVFLDAESAYYAALERPGEARRAAPRVFERELQRAETILELALEADPALYMGWVLRARMRLLRRPKDLEGALTFLESAVALEPDDIGLRLYLARVHELDNNPYGAIEQYQVVLAARPDDQEVRFNYALALRQAGRLRSAMVSLEQVLAERPRFREAAHAYGALLMETGRPRRALEHYEQMAKEYPTDPQVDYSLGVLYHVHLDDPEAALVHYGRFLERKTDVGRDTLAVESYVRQIRERQGKESGDS